MIVCLPGMHTVQGSISRSQKWGGAKWEKRKKEKVKRVGEEWKGDEGRRRREREEGRKERGGGKEELGRKLGRRMELEASEGKANKDA